MIVNRLRRGWIVVLVLIFFNFGFSWIDQGQKDTSNTQQENSVTNLPQASPVISTNQISEKIIKSGFSDIKNAVETSDDLQADEVLNTAKTKTQNYSSYRNITDAVKSAQMVSSGIVQQAKSINQNNFSVLSSDASKLQKQINNIIQVTDQFKMLQEIQVKQIEQVTKQAREYKEIMDKLEEENSESTDLSEKDAAEILRQAKIRQDRNN